MPAGHHRSTKAPANPETLGPTTAVTEPGLPGRLHRTQATSASYCALLRQCGFAWDEPTDHMKMTESMGGKKQVCMAGSVCFDGRCPTLGFYASQSVAGAIEQLARYT